VKLKVLIGAVLATVLTACGGGGGGSSSSGGSGGGGGGGGGGGSTANNAPVFSSAETASVTEQGETTVITVEASDSDSDTLTYTLSGDDASAFSLSDSNVLSFVAVPDFEAPADANTDNAYVVVISVSDGTDSVDQTVTITVTDAYEGRVIDGPISGSTVFIDLDGDYAQDADEPNGTTDTNGAFVVAKATAAEGVVPKLISIGGTDTTTNEALPDLALVADVPSAAASSAYITPISTVIAAAATVEEKAKVLESLGVKATDLGSADNAAALVEAFITKDIWSEAEAGNSVAQNLQTKNLQVAAIIQSAVTFADTGDTATAATRAIAMTNAIAGGLVTQAKADLVITSEDAITEALAAAITTYADTVEESLKTAAASATLLAENVISSLIGVVDQIATVSDPTSAAAIALVKEIQTDTLAAVETLATSVAAASSTDITTVINSAATALDTAVSASLNDAVTAAAAAETTVSNEGYRIPQSISVLETLE
jgi:hypothetical protein